MTSANMNAKYGLGFHAEQQAKYAAEIARNKIARTKRNAAQQQRFLTVGKIEQPVWKRHTDNTGDVWYVNEQTGESSWVLPPGGTLSDTK